MSNRPIFEFAFKVRKSTRKLKERGETMTHSPINAVSAEVRPGRRPPGVNKEEQSCDFLCLRVRRETLNITHPRESRWQNPSKASWDFRAFHCSASRARTGEQMILKVIGRADKNNPGRSIVGKRRRAHSTDASGNILGSHLQLRRQRPLFLQ